jgi:hypothetical protein
MAGTLALGQLAYQVGLHAKIAAAANSQCPVHADQAQNVARRDSNFRRQVITPWQDRRNRHNDPLSAVTAPTSNVGHLAAMPRPNLQLWRTTGRSVRCRSRKLSAARQLFPRNARSLRSFPQQS